MKTLIGIILIALLACSGEDPAPKIDCDKLLMNEQNASKAFLDYQKLYDPSWGDAQKDQYKQDLQKLKDAYIQAQKESSNCN